MCEIVLVRYFGLVSEDMVQGAVEGLNEALFEGQLKVPHMKVGMFCVKHLLMTLNISTAYEISMNRDYPSYGYMLANNATTLWESWQFSPSTYSHNHPMFSSIGVWFVQGLGGIRQRPWSVGYSHIWLAPRSPCVTESNPSDSLSGVNVTFETVRGVIESNWTQVNNAITENGSEGYLFNWDFVVPYGSTAEVDLPGKEIETVQAGVYHYTNVVLC